MMTNMTIHKNICSIKYSIKKYSAQKNHVISKFLCKVKKYKIHIQIKFLENLLCIVS